MTTERQSIIYAVFTTPENSIPGSAICAFYIDDIMDAFEGRFKSQKDSTSNWLPIPPENVPDPRPGKCVDDSRTLPTMSVNFIKTHTLMETSVPSMHGKPLLTRVNLKHRFTAITVDPQIEGLDGNLYDVIFVGTDDGRIIKLVNYISTNITGDAQQAEPIVVTETQALPVGQQVRELSVSRHTDTLIVIGNGHIVSIPLNHCNKILHCRDCLMLQDPYCVWDIRNHECTAVTSSSKNVYSHPINYIQRLSVGENGLCKKHGESGNWIDPPPVVVHSTRGTLASVGRSAPAGYDNEITVTSIDGVELTNQINNNHHKIHIDPLVKESLGGLDTNAENVHFGSTSIIVVMCLLFVAGVTAGVVISKLRLKLSPCYNEHRNQINAYVFYYFFFATLN